MNTNVQPLPSIDYRGSYRNDKLHPCKLNIEELRKLYVDLNRNTSEALEAYLDTVQPRQGEDPVHIENLKEEARRIGGLTIVIIGSNGEQIVSSSIDVLSKDSLPEKITSISFNSAAGLKGVNVALPNRFLLNLDFAEPPGFNEYNPWEKPTPNNSYLEVSGPNTTWVSGVSETVERFFKSKKTIRAWLHNVFTFNIYNWFFAMPLSLWAAYRISFFLQDKFENIHVALLGAILIYFVLLSLLFFRIFFAITRWLFPVVEFEGARSFKIRAAVCAFLGSPFFVLLYDLIYKLF